MKNQESITQRIVDNISNAFNAIPRTLNLEVTAPVRKRKNPKRVAAGRKAAVSAKKPVARAKRKVKAAAKTVKKAVKKATRKSPRKQAKRSARVVSLKARRARNGRSASVQARAA